MDTGTAEYFVTRDLEERRAEYRHWCETVRNPANRSTEGIQEIKSDNDSAVAQYEVAQLPSGTYGQSEFVANTDVETIPEWEHHGLTFRHALTVSPTS